MNKAVVLVDRDRLTGIGRSTALAVTGRVGEVIGAVGRDEAGKAIVKKLRAFGWKRSFINRRRQRGWNQARALV